MYRVIENLFSNISKYALEKLMQRFVRGDKSKTTEGSGLGISISKSLTELQKGIFNLQIDGDLFKVELEFDIEGKEKSFVNFQVFY